MLVLVAIFICNLIQPNKKADKNLEDLKLANIEAMAGDGGSGEGSSGSTGPVSVKDCAYPLESYNLTPRFCETTVVKCGGKDDISCSSRNCPDH